MYNHPLFLNVVLEKYKSKFLVKKYEANTLLFHEGESCNELGIILKGQLIISTLTTLDKEYIINVLNKNDLFGDTLIFRKENIYLGDGIITKDSEIMFITKELLLEMFKDQTFLQNFLTITAEKNSELRNRVKLLSHKNIEERILFYLDSECKRLKTNIIPIKSKEVLAKILNIPRPSLSRELIKLKEKKIIDYNRYNITLLIEKNTTQ